MGRMVLHCDGGTGFGHRRGTGSRSSRRRTLEILPRPGGTVLETAAAKNRLPGLEHTAAGQSCRDALARQRDLPRAFGEPVTDIPTGSAARVIHSQAEKLVRHLFFCGEYTLKDDGVDGSAAFQEAFRANRHASGDGRSLKDFQLLNRLFKYRCSYMIYSKTFAALPQLLRLEVSIQLDRVLKGEDQRPGFAHLSPGERQTIQKILVETRPEGWLQIPGAPSEFP